MFEEERYRKGATYFKKDFESIKNKKQYKEEFYLNTGLSRLRNTRIINIFTSCIVNTEYLYRVITRESKDVTIYYFNTLISIDELVKHYEGTNVKFKKIQKDPLIEFKHKTTVFALNDTVIFDSKFLGNEGYSWEEKKVYRDKSKGDFNAYYKRALSLI